MAVQSSIGKQQSKIGVGVLASGSGSNFEALVQATRDGRVARGEVRVLITNRPDAGALDRAKRLNVEGVVLEPKNYLSLEAYFDGVAAELDRCGVQIVCLAGFLLKIDPVLLKKFPGRVLNIHPALLPKYGGKGMYGRRVHEAVLRSADKESGCSVHLVDEQYDHGPVLRRVPVPIFPGDTSESLAARVLEQEHRAYPEVLNELIHKLF